MGRSARPRRLYTHGSLALSRLLGGSIHPRSRDRHFRSYTSLSDVQEIDPDVMKASEFISLTDDEKKIFEHLRNACTYHNLNTTVRVAGGWVRDKLLGMGSDDIDIAVDNMMGEQFAALVNSYLDAQGLDTRTVAVIKTNPEKSKHLATATFRVGDRAIDVNHLRSEEYATDSRIPEIKVGTPWEDAYRRDLTINAMYYNVNDDTIEDYTRRGMKDLEAKLARTPLASLETLIDDPLRILRTLRFSARFDLKLDGEFETAAIHEDVKMGLANKVSRERFGQEIVKALEGPGRPGFMLSGLAKFGLNSIVFPDVPGNPPVLHTADPSPDPGLTQEERRVFSVRMVERMQSYLESNCKDTYKDEQMRKSLLLASFLYPFHGLSGKSPKKRQHSMVFMMLTEGIKYPHRDAQEVDILVQSSPFLLSLARALSSLNFTPRSESIVTPTEAINGSNGGLDFLRLQLGRLLSDIKELWIPAITLAKVSVLTEIEGKEEFDSSEDIKNLERLQTWVEENDLSSVWTVQPLLNGRDIMTTFGVKGNEVGKIVDLQKEWLLLNPKASRDECTAFLEKAKLED